MNIRSFSILLSLFSLTAHAQKAASSDSFYASVWRNYEKHIRDGRPKSALALAGTIRNRARLEHNFPQWAKACMSGMAQRQQIAPDSLVNDLRQFESFAGLFGQPAEQAIYHLLMASAYEEARQSYTYTSDQEHMTFFKRQASAHLDSAGALLPLLTGVDATPYRPLFEKGGDSRLFGNDVLSLATGFVQDSHWIEEPRRLDWTERAIQLYDSRGMHDACVWQRMVRLRLLNASTVRARHLPDHDYIDSLKALYTTNREVEAAADVFLAYMQQTAHSFTFAQRVDLVRWAMRQWPASPLLPNLKSMEQDWLMPQLRIEAETDSCVAGLPQRFIISHRQLGGQGDVCVTVSRLDKDRRGRLKTGEKVCTRTLRFEQQGEVEEWQDSVFFLTLPPGQLRITAQAQGKKAYTDMTCSSVKVLFSELTPDRRRVTVVDARSGLPLPQCRVEGWWTEREWNDSHRSYVTAEDGTADVDPRITMVKAYRSENDSTEDGCVLYGRSRPPKAGREKTSHNNTIFTDRAVYRPGQTVHAALISYTQEGDETHANDGTPLTLTLRDSNGQQLQSASLQTDRFGTASTDFVLPKQCLNGPFTLRCGSASRTIRVEAYKRPTFEVVFDTLQETHALGDTIRIAGRAQTFAGTPVQNASVCYSIATRRNPWFRWYGSNSTLQLSDSCTTDSEGRFSFLATLDDGETDHVTATGKRHTHDVLTLQATADVTDEAGETQTGRFDVRASEVGFSLKADMPAVIDTDTCRNILCTWTAWTPDGTETATEGRWTLRVWNPALQQYADTIATGTFATSIPVEIASSGTLKDGSYLLEASSADHRGTPVASSQEVVVWSHSRLTAACDTTSAQGYDSRMKDDFFAVSKTECQTGDTVDFWLATSRPQPYVMFTVASKDSILHDHAATLDRGLYHYRLHFDTRCGDGIQAMFTYVENGRVHQQRLYVQKAAPEKRLELKWKTFRDRLTPGQEETWTLSIRDNEGKPVAAQFMSTLYDASLDPIQTHTWPFRVTFARQLPSLRTSVSSSWMSASLTVPFGRPDIQTYSRQFNSLRPFGFYLGERNVFDTVHPRRRLGLGRNVLMMKQATQNATASVEAMESTRANGMADWDGTESEQDRSTTGKRTDTPATLRENFSETAFFYPTLTTNSRGEVDIHFTLPDCITRWKLEGLAHTRDMQYGAIRASVEARKEFMIRPHMPRFVRTGDRVSLPALITNTTTRTVGGRATLLLTDPSDGHLVMKAHMPFTVKAGGTTTVAFDFQTPENTDMLVCEIQAGDKRFSDGERNWLPVLSASKRLVEAYPFYIEGKGTATMDCGQLFNRQSATASRKKAWIEYTDQPAWQSVLALRSIPMPQDDNVVSWSAALFAQAATVRMARQIPNIQQLLRLWQETGEKDSPLQSELDRNSDLKEFLTQETPWAMEAQTERTQRQSLAQMFDVNVQNQNIRTALDKMASLQHRDGGWSWFPGMQTSAFTTLEVCEHLVRLQNNLNRDAGKKSVMLRNLKTAIEGMTEKSLAYLSTEELKTYDTYYKKDRRSMPSDHSIRFLHLLAQADKIQGLTGRMREMKEDYLDRMERSVKTTSLYQRAQLVPTFLAAGRKQAAIRYATSLHEHLVTRQSMGSYFDNDETRASWNDRRLATHTASMRAFELTLWSTGTPDRQKERNDMLLWLLRQKQGQQWDNVVNTLDACEWLLHTAPDSLLALGRLPEVRIGTSDMKLEDNIPGIGYVRSPLSTDRIARPDTHITIQSQTDGMHWGTVFTECLDRTAAVQTSQGDLRIGTKWYRKTVSNGPDTSQDQDTWMEIGEKTHLHVGDRIRIRHIIETDRDLNFVQVKAQRAACLEPSVQRSGYIRAGHGGCYQVNHDASTDFFFDSLGKGTTTLDTEYFVTRSGTYQAGITSVQCAYNASLTGHSSGRTVHVEK